MSDDPRPSLANVLGPPAGAPSDEVIQQAYAYDPQDEDTTDPQVVAAGTWTIDDDRTAEWAMARLTEIEAAAQADEALAQEWSAQIREWLLTRNRPRQNSSAFFEARLIAYQRARREVDPKRNKTLVLPSGRVTSRGGGDPRVSVVDDEAYLAWALKRLRDLPDQPPLLKMTPALAQLQKVAGAKVGAGAVVDGEVVPGTAVEEPEVGYSVKPGA